MKTKDLVPRHPIRMFATMEKKARNSLLNTVIYLGERGFHAKTIAKVAGITPSQVYAICNKFQVKLRAYRDGQTEPAERIIRKSPTITVRMVSWEKVKAALEE
jgi:hypothetical protein